MAHNRNREYNQGIKDARVEYYDPFYLVQKDAPSSEFLNTKYTRDKWTPIRIRTDIICKKSAAIHGVSVE